MHIVAALAGIVVWLALYIGWAQYAPWGSAWLHAGGYGCITWFIAAVLVSAWGGKRPSPWTDSAD